MKRNATRSFLLILLLAAGYCLQAQTIRYVKAGSTGDGSSWSNASGDLQGIINASGTGDEVWVAQGTYKPTSGTDRRISFSMKSGVGIYGGFAGTETSLNQGNLKNNPTILSGDIGTTGDNSDNSYHVVNNFYNNLDNTAVLNGFTITGGNASGGDRGGGVNNSSSGSPLFANCIFTGNTASTSGGGMVNQNSFPTLINCIFINNSAYNGGGMLNFSASAPTLINCSFAGNSASSSGGAIRNENTSPIITNCIIWGNSDEINGGTPTVTYSIIRGGYGGTGNLDQDPLFVDAANGDLHLQPCSPAIDAGNDAANSTTQDLDGNPRKVRTIDMGAYEYQGALATAPAITTQPFTGQTICQGTTPATLSVSATGSGLSYEWYSNSTNSNSGGTLISGANSASYTPTTTSAGTTYYYVIVTGTCNSVTSDVAQVTVTASTTWYRDTDGDGYGDPAQNQQACTQPSGYVANNSDCDDGNVMINPATVWYKDGDGDGYSDGATLTQCARPAGYKLASELTALSGDCNDTKATVHPGAIEICGNGIDDNCDGQVDEGCTLPPLTVTIYPSFTLEGNSGKHYMYFTLQLNRPAPSSCEITYETHNGTAKAGSDYQGVDDKEVSFSKGQSTKTVGVYIYGDRAVEKDETFTVEIEHPEHVKIAGADHVTGIIINDDYAHCNTTEAADVALKAVEENQMLEVPNLLHRSQLWRIPNLPGRNQILVMDVNGRTVLKAENYAGDRSFNNAAAGIYFYQIITSDQNGTSKTYTGKLFIVE